MGFTMMALILSEVKRRKIEYIVHFTRIKNLESILTNGLMSRSVLKERKIPFEYNDSTRWDERQDCTSFSIEYPNEFLFGKFKERYRDSRWCVLRLNIVDVLQNHNGMKYYCMKNAAGSPSKWLKGADNAFSLSSYPAFKNMFQETNPDSRHAYTRTDKKLKDYLPTHHQAEILITNTIEPKYITTVFFQNREELTHFEEILGNKNLLQQFNFQCDDFYFKKRDNVVWGDR